MATDAKFKVGDRVRFCPCLPTAEEFWNRQGTVQSVEGSKYLRVQIDDMPTTYGHMASVEQLEPALSPGRALTEDGSVRVNEEQAEALKPKADRYTQHREYWSGEGSVMLESWHQNNPGNQAARARNIAVLAAELSKPVTPRFPAEGRSDRALSVTNGMIRGRE